MLIGSLYKANLAPEGTYVIYPLVLIVHPNSGHSDARY